MVYILISSILLMPWLFLPIPGIDAVRLPKAIMFDLVCLALISYGIFRGLEFSYRNKYLAVLVAWGFITIGFNWYYPLLMNIGFNAGTIEASIHFILATVATLFILSSLNRDEYLLLARFVCYSAMAVSAFGIFQIIGLDPLKYIAKYKPTEHNHLCALIDHPDTLGNFLALAVPFFLLFKEHKFKLGLILVLAIIYFTHSSLSMASAVVSILLFLFLKYRRRNQRIALLVVTLLFGLFCFLTPFNKLHSGFTGRLEVWKLSLNYIDKNPIFGGGLGVFKAFGIGTGFNLSKQGGNIWVFAHNDYLEIVAALGFLGLFLFLLVVSNSLRRFNYKPENIIGFSYIASFVGFLILMIGSFPMEIAPIALLGIFSFCGTEKL